MDTVSRSVPKYEILAAKVARQIQCGALAPGRPVPSIRSLMSEHRLSMGTVVKGLELLEHQGMVDRHPQRGYFVAHPQQEKAAARQIAFITQALSGDTNYFLDGFSSGLDHQHFSLATYSSATDQSRYQAILEQVVGQHPAGIILCSGLPRELCPIDPRVVAESRIPAVVLGRALDGLVCDCVRQNSRVAGRKLARYLLDRGCRDFAMLIYPCDLFAPDLLAALRAELAPAGQDLPDDRVFIVDSPHGFAFPIDPCIDAQVAVEQLIKKGLTFKTLICCHDYPAVGALRALAAAGLSVPGDVAVASGGGCSIDGASHVKLTTINHHRDEQAMIAAELLLHRIEDHRGNGHDGPFEIHYVSADLVIGDTA